MWTASEDVHYDYDESNATTGCTSSYPVGHLTRMTDVSGTTTYCYDAHGNVILKRHGTTTSAPTTTYTYNSADRLMAVGYPDGAAVAYTRNADGQIATVAATSVTGMTTNVVTAIHYLPLGPADSYTFGNGQTQTRTYDQDYRSTGVASNALYLQYTLNAIGNPVALNTAAGQTSPVESYLYDPLNRLQQVDEAGVPWQSYTYDKAGDRLTKATAGIGTDSYQYQSGTHRLINITGADPSARAMDANGNTSGLQANGWTYGLGYDDSNRLVVAQQNGSTVMQYLINGQGERVEKNTPFVRPPICVDPPIYGHPIRKPCPTPTPTTPASFEYFSYGQAGRLLSENTGSATRDYVWAGSTLVAILDNPAQLNDIVHYVYTDGLGTPRAVTTQAGTEVWDWPAIQNPFGERAASGNGYTLNLRFPGEYFDSETGLDYNFFRDYESATGRYIESDPMGLGGGISTYGYVNSEPTNHADPKGLFKLVSQSSGVGAKGGVQCASGTLEPFFDMNAFRSQCTAVQECLIEHENTHIADANQANPDICHWYNGTLSDKTVLAPSSAVEAMRTELHAFNVELNCLEARLKERQCTKDKCQHQIRYQIMLIENVYIPEILSGKYIGQ